MNPLKKHDLEMIATKGRLMGLDMVYRCASGHLGGSYSSMDILVTLYFNVMQNLNTDNTTEKNRDRFVMSKGHCTPGLYPVLAQRGFFLEKELENFRHIDGHMSGHAEMSHVAGVDMSTGSLGQGFSAAIGMAIAGKMTNEEYRVYALLGDGELAEGQIWEACLSASKYKLDNLCAIVDVNGLQIDGKTSDVMPTEPLDQKFEAFGFHVLKIDGHNYDEIEHAFNQAKQNKNAPTVILARTVKGKGVSFMENNPGWHGKAPNEEQYLLARAEIIEKLNELEGQ